MGEYVLLRTHATQCDKCGDHLRELAGFGTVKVHIRLWPSGYDIGLLHCEPEV